MKATIYASDHNPSFHAEYVQLRMPTDWAIDKVVFITYGYDEVSQLRVHPELEDAFRYVARRLADHSANQLDVACTELPDSGLTITKIYCDIQP